MSEYTIKVQNEEIAFYGDVEDAKWATVDAAEQHNAAAELINDYYIAATGETKTISVFEYNPS